MKPPKNAVSAADLDKLNKGDKRKMIFMGVLLVVVSAAWITSLFQEKKHQENEGGDLPVFDEPGTTPEIALPAFDAAKITAEIDDSKEDGRLKVPGSALDGAVELVGKLVKAHYEVLGIRELDGEVAAEIAADPGAHRLEPFALWGTLDVETLRTQARGSGRKEEVVGLMTLEDGTKAWVIVLHTPEIVNMQPFLHVKGLYLQQYKQETETEGWVDAPLFVGAKAVRSYPALGEVKELDEQLLAATEDDSASGVTEFPFELKWQVMAYARDLEEGAIDWAAAPELNNESMTEMLKDGDAWRGKPMRIPISKNMGSWVEEAPENPARVRTVTKGWIGNWTWSNNAGVIHFIAPFAQPDMQTARLVEGRGFFIRNFAYEPKDGGMRVAPYFVLADVHEFVPKKDPSIEYLFIGVGILTVLLIFFFWFMLMRGKKEAAALQQELIRRRRARRARSGDGGGLSPAES